VHELGFDLPELESIVDAYDEPLYLHVSIGEGSESEWIDQLATTFRRCYISDERLKEAESRTGRTRRELLEAVLPDRGSVMAGDFGEILAAVGQAVLEMPEPLLMAKKWRYKASRHASAPYSDVVQFSLPSAPKFSANDRVLCAEVKTKSTNGTSSPIRSAIADSGKDRAGRLGKTLVWLRDRSHFEDLGSVTFDVLQRFINVADNLPSTRVYYAIAVISADLAEYELEELPSDGYPDGRLVIVKVSDLKSIYERIYDFLLLNADL
jgi:hypothetical protein